MAFNRFALALIVCLLPGFASAAQNSLQDASQLFRQGKTVQALDKVDKYLADNTKDPQARFLKGLILAEMNRTQEAIKIFTELTEDYPDLPEPYNNLAVLYASQGKYELAKNSLEKAIRTNPTYATAHENLGDIYAKMASQAYDKALQLDKSNATAQMKLALVKDIFTPAALEKPKQAKRNPGKATVVVQETPRTPETAATTPSPAKPTSADKPQTGPTQTDPAVEKAIQDWATAWSARDVPGYLSFYGTSFAPPKGLSRSDWEAQRSSRLTAPQYIKVTVFDFKIERKGNRANAVFKETYESNLLKSTTDKYLTLELQDGAWKIVAER
jgi:tetratricopeptide (TPR) repeat protein